MHVATLLRMPMLIPECVERLAVKAVGLQRLRSGPISPEMDSARRIAHDLNNIAFVISGYAQQIEETLASTDPMQRDVQAILAEIPRLTAVVDRIRSLEPSADVESSLNVMVSDSTPQPRILLVEDEAAVRDRELRGNRRDLTPR